MIDSGNLAWMMIASAMVLLMTPGLALFYGGLVKHKNIINTLMLSFVSLGIVTVIWVTYGYSLAFSTNNAFIGGFNNLFLTNIDLNDANTVVFIAFQGMFAVITPAIITGAFVERFKFSTYLIFLVLWVTFVYIPICHWVWAEGGWLYERGALDFAGGTVVHISSGMAAIVCAYLVGSRINVKRTHKPENIPYVLFGSAILWFGWFGFNVGSELAVNARAVNAFLVTNISAATAMTTWFLVEYLHTKKFSAIGLASGAIAGLVAITPAAGFVSPASALIIGFITGVICYFILVLIKHYTSLDDALDVFPIHGVGGIIGSLATGIFAVEAIGGTQGVIEGNTKIILEQGIAVLATMGYSLGQTFIILILLKKFMGLRVDILDESNGLDSQH
tara:strand:- start:4837 stop:6006 length:1170 start_codon:yes stop_codon:yes gene_type:complete